MKKTMIKKLTALIATAVAAVSCGTMTSSASEAGASATLSTTSGIAGELVTVNLVLDTDNMCNGYSFDITFDEALELKGVEGAFASEVNGNVATVVNLTGMYFQDDKPVTALTFEIPEDAAEGTSYNVEITNASNFTYDGGEFINPVLQSGSIDVLESAKAVTNHVVYEKQENGMTVREVALRGDANHDDKVDLTDCVAVAKNMLKPGSLQGIMSFCADVNSDGTVNLTDLVFLCKYKLASGKDNAWESVMSK